jgi:putative transposase
MFAAGYLAAAYRQPGAPAAGHREYISKQREFESRGPPTAGLVGYLGTMAKKISKCDFIWRWSEPRKFLQEWVESVTFEGMDHEAKKPSRFTEEQIIGILREQEAGAATADVCRKHGISSATFYKWKAKYGGLEVSDAKRLKTLEDENAKLKKLLAEAMLDNAMLKDVASKKW